MQITDTIDVSGLVPNTRKINGQPLSADINISSSSFIEVTLLAANWGLETRQQTVAAVGVTDENNVYPQTPVSRVEYLAFGDAAISCISQAVDELVFECSLIPTINLTLVIEITN